jgi:hypothetical protein
MKTNYPRLWTRLQNAGSPEEAAAAFATQYLKPARPHLIQRLNDIRSGGVRQSMAGGSRQGLIHQVPGRPAASPGQQMANEAYARRLGRMFNAANPDWRRSEDIEDRRQDTPGAEIARQWGQDEGESDQVIRDFLRTAGPTTRRRPPPDPNNPLARALGIDELGLGPRQ